MEGIKKLSPKTLVERPRIRGCQSYDAPTPSEALYFIKISLFVIHAMKKNMQHIKPIIYEELSSHYNNILALKVHYAGFLTPHFKCVLERMVAIRFP